jgi:hypothetical protein
MRAIRTPTFRWSSVELLGIAIQKIVSFGLTEAYYCHMVITTQRVRVGNGFYSTLNILIYK